MACDASAPKLKKASLFSGYRADINEEHLDVLDGVRALFVFVVAWFHIWQQSWLMPIGYVGGVLVNLDFVPRTGYMGVDGMIFLSGLLLMYPYTKKTARDPKPLSFYRKRLSRILPGYLLALLVSLFLDALPKHAYRDAWELIRDLLAHLTFTHTWFPFSYTGSPLSGVLWTLSVEVQFYALFPLVCRLYRRHPAWTAGGMALLAFLWRAWAAGYQDTSLLINQLPAFLDTYAWGFLSATVIRALMGKLRGEGRPEKVFFTFCACAGFALLVRVTKDQAATVGIEAIRLGQMSRRFALGAAFCLVCVGLCFSLPAARFLFGNGLARFLSAVSYQFYLWHQVITLHLKEWGIPPSSSTQPWVDGERSWQWPYVALCFLLSLALSALLTYLFERPLQKRLRGSVRS